MKKKPTEDKIITISLSAETYEKLKDLAGPNVTPEDYLNRTINELAEGKKGERTPPGMFDYNTYFVEMVRKLDGLASNIERLTKITLDSRASGEDIRMKPSPAPWNRGDSYESGFTSHDISSEKGSGKQNESLMPPSSYGDHFMPVPQPVQDQETGEEPSLEEKIKKYEEDNPW
jgi:hypothetical protein